MINLLKKFKNILSDKGINTVIYKTNNYIYLNDKNVKIRIANNSYINDLFDPLDNYEYYRYNELLKAKKVSCDYYGDDLQEFLNVPVYYGAELPCVKLSNTNYNEVCNHAYIFDGYLWIIDSSYLLRHVLPEKTKKEVKLNIPNLIYNLFSKIDYIKQSENYVQIFGLINKQTYITIEYKMLFELDKNISLIKGVSKPLDICDDGVIYDLNEVYNLKLSSKKQENLIKYNDGIISVKNLRFNHIKEIAIHNEFKNILKPFTVDFYYLNKFKKLFKNAFIKAYSTISGNQFQITMNKGKNAMILMCFRD